MSDAKQLRVYLSSSNMEDIQQLADRIELELPDDADVEIRTSEPMPVPGRSGAELILPLISLTISGIQTVLAVMEAIEKYRELNADMDVELELKDGDSQRTVTVKKTLSKRQARKEIEKLLAKPTLMQRMRNALGKDKRPT